MGRISFLIPSHMLLFDCKSGVKGGANFVGIEDASTDGFYCYLVYSFYLIHVSVHLCLETWSLASLLI